MADDRNSQWTEVDARLREFIDLQAGDRSAALTALGRENPEVAAEVGALLAHADVEDDEFEERLRSLPSSLLRSALDETVADGELSAGSEVGRYRIVETVGRGGTGSVYRAERVDGEYEQHVALKVLRRGLDTHDVLTRFRAERQILASLDHPHIARLSDGGSTGDGRPYLVIEYVEGLPIDEFCEAGNLSVRERLELFLQVCDAVSHAHRSLVLHRDIKPSNILVGAGGSACLLDFGIAKMLDPGRIPGGGAHTRTGHRLFTPDYAAPEQVLGGAVGVATDVYQLGVLLNKLLTGASPYVLEETASVADLQQAIVDGRVQPLSRIAHRNVLRARQLRGDLDTIVLKTLRTESERRYRSVDMLAADVRAYLSGYPVSARPASVRYRAGKFVRRNPTAVAAAAVAVVLLLALSAVSASYAINSSAQAREIAAERDRAEQVTNYLIGIFEGSDPDLDRGDTITARTLLDRGAARIDAELNDRPELRASMLSAIGGAYHALGLYTESERHHRASLELQEAAHGLDDSGLIGTLNALGSSLTYQGRRAEAIEVERDVLERVVARHGRESSDAAGAMNNLALSLSHDGEYAEAERLYREALAIHERGEDLRSTEVVSHNLAILLGLTGRAEEAIPLHRRAVRIARERDASPHRDLARAVNALAFTLQRAGEPAEAERYHTEALEMRRAIFPAGHPDIASSEARLALLMIETGRAVEAEPLAAGAYEALSERIPEAWETVAARGILGLAQMAQGRFEEGEPLLRESYTHFLERFGAEDWRTRDAARALAGIYAAAGREAEAAALVSEGGSR